jgi:acyl-coenzyme A thioesterase PaaI-like protein
LLNAAFAMAILDLISHVHLYREVNVSSSFLNTFKT